MTYVYGLDNVRDAIRESRKVLTRIAEALEAQNPVSYTVHIHTAADPEQIAAQVEKAIERLEARRKKDKQ